MTSAPLIRKPGKKTCKTRNLKSACAGNAHLEARGRASCASRQGGAKMRLMTLTSGPSRPASARVPSHLRPRGYAPPEGRVPERTHWKQPGAAEAQSLPGARLSRPRQSAAEQARDGLLQSFSGERTQAWIHDQLFELGIRHRAQCDLIVASLLRGRVIRHTGGRGWQARYSRID